MAILQRQAAGNIWEAGGIVRWNTDDTDKTNILDWICANLFNPCHPCSCIYLER